MAMALMAVGGFIGGSIASPMLNAVIEPVTYGLQKKSWGHFKGRLAREDILVQAYYLGYISYDELKSYMSQLGYDEKQTNSYVTAYRRLMDVTAVLQAWARGLMDDKELTEYLGKQGYDQKDVERLKQISQTLPSPSDLIDMAVKEAFNPEASKELNLDDEFDLNWGQMEPWARKVFMSKDVMRLYWRAHWRLPSPEEVITMYNMFYPLIMYTKLPNGKYYGEKYNKYIGDFRKIITDDALVDKYLKWEDISPIWRARFKAMTYPPITRVDLRRIYALGLIDDSEMLARIMQLGYSEEDAKLLLAFYKQYKLNEQRTLTKSEIKKAYQVHLIDRDKAISYLQQLQYDQDEAEFYLKLWDYENQNTKLKAQLNALKKEYLEGYKSLEEVSDELNKLGLPAQSIQYYLDEFQADKRASVKLPSKSDVEHWYKLGLISDQTAVNLLKLLGYPESIAYMYIQTARNVKSDKVELPTKSDIEHFLKAELINEDQARTLLKQHGYTDEIINLYIQLWSKTS